MIQAVEVLIGVILIGFWLWMLVDLTNNTYIPKESKNKWFLAFILLNVFGAVWYYVVEYRNRNL
jgi:hypothetical protein